MYSNMKYYENICNCLRVIQQNINRKLKSANCWQRTSLNVTYYANVLDANVLKSIDTRWVADDNSGDKYTPPLFLSGQKQRHSTHTPFCATPVWLAQFVACLGLRPGVRRFNSRVRHILSLVVSFM